MKIQDSVFLSAIDVTWPHQVNIGNNVHIEKNVYFKYDGPYKKDISIIIGDNTFIGTQCEFNVAEKAIIGSNCLIASGCRFIDHDHGVDLAYLIRTQKGINEPIILGDDVWVGANSIILKGVRIGNGAVVAAGSVVTKDIPPNEIWAGVPAKKINQRI